MAETTTTPDRAERPGALDVPTTDRADLVKPAPDRYLEDEAYLPNPYWQYGTVDTSDTAGGAHQSVAEVSPVFAMSRVNNLLTAARALDPEDDGVGAELVTLPQGAVTVTGTTKTADEGRDDIAGALRRLSEDPLLLGGPTEQQKLAAEEADDTGNPEAEGSGATTTTAPNRASSSATTSTTRPTRATK